MEIKPFKFWVPATLQCRRQACNLPQVSWGSAGPLRAEAADLPPISHPQLTAAFHGFVLGELICPSQDNALFTFVKFWRNPAF